MRRMRTGELVLVALALALLLYRFGHDDVLTFVNDEPNLLRAAHEQLVTGQWVSTSPIFGTQGLRYGPAPTWFYGVVQAAFGPSPLVCIRAMTVLLTAALLALVFALSRTFGGRARWALFAALLAVAASSPYLFVWSRQAWDNPLVAASAALVVALLARRAVGLGHAAIAALLFGVMIATHLMATPFVACAGVAVVLAVARAPSRRPLVVRAARAAGAGVLLAAGVLLVNAKYLPYVRASQAAVHGGPAVPFTEIVKAVPTWLAEPARVASLWDVDYFFGSSWSDFREWVGSLAVVFDLATVPGVLVLACGAGLVLASLRARLPEQRRVARLALAVWIFHAVFLASRGLERHPHYQMPTTWIVPAGLAALVAWVRSRSARASRAVLAGMWTLAAAQLVFQIAWMRWAEARQGTREVHFATPLAQQTRVVREACTRTHTTDVHLGNQTVLYPTSLSYIAETDPACAGFHVTVCNGACPGGSTFTVAYAPGQLGGAIVLE